ncbi:minichromosome maintenance domain-containing protein 2-like [Anticarsia gemmatalis]|uniref:minichromosome maintenance domain-containing protein 2-like n=1 Tax=Anticarsia gemmatalis TaxID=129554 RepID=UPI003F75CE0D
MELQCALLLYLDNRRHLNDMKIECDKFLEQLTEKMLSKFPPMRYILEIDVMDLIDVFPDLGNLLVTEPMQFQKMVNNILYSALQSTDNEMRSRIEYAQVGVTIRMKSVPQLFEPNPRIYKGLVTFEGLLISFSKPESYIYHSVWSCPEECEGNEVILHYIPKYPPKCYMCKSVLFENSGLRRCGDKVTATFQIKDEIFSKKFHIVDDLIAILNLGSRYVLHAIVSKKVTSVWSIEKVIPLPAPITSPIPKDVEELYQACNGVPWKFIYCLASSLGVNVCPLNCFMHLKISLLLSLTSIKANAVTGASIIHVLVGGFDSRFVPAIMVDAAKLAEQSAYLGMSNSVPSTALIASSGGICVLPLPLHIYNHRQVSGILSAIETGTINTDCGTTKLKAAVWAQGMDFKKMILYNVASVFGNVCRGDYGEYNDEIADFVLQQAMEPTKTSREEIQALKDVTAYIDLVAGVEVILDVATENLLQSYFIAARKENTKNATIGSMTSLVAACLTSARLCRRSVAVIDDAVFAIWLHVSGSPEPRFAPEEYLQTPADVRKLQKIINKFKDWLEQFTGHCI